MFSTLGGGGSECSVHQGDTMSISGDTMSTSGGYHDYIGGDIMGASGVFSSSEDSMTTSGDVQYILGIS